MHHSELREQIVSMRYVVSQTEQNAHMYYVLCTAKAKKRTKLLMKNLMICFESFWTCLARNGHSEMNPDLQVFLFDCFAQRLITIFNINLL